VLIGIKILFGYCWL